MSYKINHTIDDTKKIRKQGDPIWRYMELWKFISLLEKKALFFPSYKLLGDQNEGRIPDNIQNWLSGKGIELKNVYDDEISKTYISSWFQSRYESFAFWKIYAKDRFGIAIRTSIKKIIESLMETSYDVNITKIVYENEPVILKLNLDDLLRYKKEYYLYENEIRLISKVVYENEDKRQDHILVSVDVDHLIEDVVISEFAYDNGMLEVVKDLKEKYKLNFSILKSELRDSWL